MTAASLLLNRLPCYRLDPQLARSAPRGRRSSPSRGGPHPHRHLPTAIETQNTDEHAATPDSSVPEAPTLQAQVI